MDNFVASSCQRKTSHKGLSFNVNCLLSDADADNSHEIPSGIWFLLKFNKIVNLCHQGFKVYQCCIKIGSSEGQTD